MNIVIGFKLRVYNIDYTGITGEERRRRKKRNTVSTGYNLAVWVVEIVSMIILLIPMVGVTLAKIDYSVRNLVACRHVCVRGRPPTQ